MLDAIRARDLGTCIRRSRDIVAVVKGPVGLDAGEAKGVAEGTKGEGGAVRRGGRRNSRLFLEVNGRHSGNLYLGNSNTAGVRQVPAVVQIDRTLKQRGETRGGSLPSGQAPRRITPP
jgi:hypothetical protein